MSTARRMLCPLQDLNDCDSINTLFDTRFEISRSLDVVPYLSVTDFKVQCISLGSYDVSLLLHFIKFRQTDCKACYTCTLITYLYEMILIIQF